jgi:alkylation response protein AidB-like acyl-CoA dehydrogenase
MSEQAVNGAAASGEVVSGLSDELDRFRRDITAQLSLLLASRDATFRTRVLGAGSDDFESGRRFLATLADGGYAVPTWPIEHGGMGLHRDRADIVADVLAGFATPDMYPFLVGLDLVGPTLLEHGSVEQQARWLPPMRDGTEIWCQGFSEPDAGSDLANLKTRAERRPDGWHVTGSKVWTSRAHYSRRCLLLARSDPSVPKHAGIIAFGLDLSSPGVEVRPLVQMNGDTHFNEVFLDDVVIPDADRIGAPGDGWRVALTCLSFERGSLAGDLGVSLEQLKDLAETDRGSRPPTRDRLLRAVADLRVLQMSGQRALAARRAGRPPGPEDSGAKLRTNRMIKQVAALALEVEGPSGVTGSPRQELPPSGFPGKGSPADPSWRGSPADPSWRGSPADPSWRGSPADPSSSRSPTDAWQTMFLVGPSLSIRGGTDEIQHNILGERVLGLPSEPRVDKGKPFTDRSDH